MKVSQWSETTTLYSEANLLLFFRKKIRNISHLLFLIPILKDTSVVIKWNLIHLRRWGTKVIRCLAWLNRYYKHLVNREKFISSDWEKIQCSALLNYNKKLHLEMLNQKEVVSNDELKLKLQFYSIILMYELNWEIKYQYLELLT